MIAIYLATDGPLNRFLYWTHELGRLGIRVPDVLDLVGRCVVLRDLGTQCLEKIVAQGRLSDEMIQQAFMLLVRLREVSPEAYLDRVDNREVSLRKYADQMDDCRMAIQARGARRLLTPSECAFINRQIDAVVRRFPQFSIGKDALAFWDYHSRNLLWHDEAFYVIDYQDIRVTSPEHDVAALLYDPYMANGAQFRRRFKYVTGVRDTPTVQLLARQRILHAIAVYLRMILSRRRIAYARPLKTAVELLGLLR